jgi:hypothetical protein
MSTVAFALAFTADIGSLQALNAILNGSQDTNPYLLVKDVTIQGGATQQAIQHAFVVLIALFYTSIGIVLVRRNPEGGNIFLYTQVSQILNLGR